MRLPKRSIFAMAMMGLASACALASATNVYIAQTAAGIADGSSCANAHAYSFFNSSGNWGNGATQIGPGTIAHLCGTITGSAGAQLLAFQASGTAGSPITLLFESGAIAQAPYFAPSTGGGGCGGGICGAGRSYITIDGGSNGVMQNTANNTGNAHNTEMIDMHNCNHCTAQNLTITNVYVRSSTSDTALDETQMKCIEFNGSNLLIKGNTINYAGWCLFDAYQNGDSNIEISYNRLTNFAHAMMFAASAGNAATNVFIHDNEFAGPGTTWDGSGCPFHQDGIHVFGVAGSSIDNFYFYNNYFHGDWGQCPTGWVFVEGGGSSTPANLKNSYWWNNVGIVNTSGQVTNTNGWFNVSSGNSGSQMFFDNTIIGPGNVDDTACFSLSNLSGVTFENNTISNCGDPIFTNSITITSLDYNFYGPSCNAGNCFVWKGSFTGSFSAWRSACGCDAHAIQNNTPLLNADGSPQTGSPVIGAGANLTSSATGNLVTLANDTTRGNTRTAVSRPSAGGWTVGAYASGTTQTQGPATPTGLVLTVF